MKIVKKKLEIRVEIIDNAIHQLTKLEPSEIAIFLDLIDVERKTIKEYSSYYYDVYVFMKEYTPEVFFRKLADFIELKKGFKK